MVQDRTKVTINDYRNMRFRSVQSRWPWMTLNCC